jgi:sugar phosphate isomerase/epimerase
MPIKLAFSTVACPNWTLDEVAKRAAEMGYQGVELRTLGQGSSMLSSDPALTDSAKVADVFSKAGIEPMCLSTSIALHHKHDTPARQAMKQAREAIDLAAALGCPYVRLFGHEVRPGDNRRSTIIRIAERASELADRAGEKGVQVLLENAGSYNTAKEWWWVFNLISNPMVGMCWNVANAASAGEPPSVSVPNLNSRIRVAKVKDADIGSGSGFVQLGDGTCEIPQFIKRLMGIGFNGYITVEWDRLWLGDALAPAEEVLPESHARLTAWIKAITDEMQDARDKAAAAAAKAAAKKK